MPVSSESTSLYRRHRPGSLDEVVGQPHVVRTLRNAIEQGKVHHAYLFVGSRGTGKTSMAKILARSLNCERGGPTVTPCGECDACQTIAAGTSIDVVEMDAASNRSVDDVRDLRERVAYAPAGGHWKVYILDEAHMLTKEAWNAFLKTLEEPPPNTVFVLATTESHKVMATIADRCQRFDFQRPSLEQISEVLRRVAKAEGIEVDDGAVAMIARSASGSFRDALGTLDQLVAFGGNKVSLEAVLELLGAADAELLFAAVDAVVAEDPKGVLLEVEKMARSGRDPTQFARDLLSHLRHLLVTQTIGEVPNTFVVTATDSGRLAAQASAIGAPTLVRTIDELAAALIAVREGDDARMAVEIALLKASRPDLDPSTEGLLRRVERLEGALSGDSGAAAPATGQDSSSQAAGEKPSPAPPAAEAPSESAAKTSKPDNAEPEPPTAEAPQESAAEPAKSETPDPAPSPPAAKETSPDDASEPSSSQPPPEDDPQPAEPEAKPAATPSESEPSPAEPESQQPSPESEASGGEPSKSVAEDAADTPAGEGDASGGDSPPAGQEPTSDSGADPGAAASTSLDLDGIRRIWPAVLDHLSKTSPALAAAFEGARPVAVDSTQATVTIGFPADSTFNKRKAEGPEKREQLAASLEAVAAEKLGPIYEMLDSETAPDDSASKKEQMDTTALVERIKSEFDAEEVS